MQRVSLLAALLVGLIAASAVAQTPPPDGTPTRIRGTVEKLDGGTLVVKARDGSEVMIMLAEKVAVAVLVKKTLPDIKPGDYVASTAVKGSDRKLHSVEVRIFPESMRGTGEGQRPWDLTPDSVMTNATVGTITEAPSGQVLHVTYKGGESDLIVGPECPVLANADGDMSLVKPGAAVFVIALKKPDGTITAARLYAEKDGIKPPM